jgi:hypothetical protein
MEKIWLASRNEEVQQKRQMEEVRKSMKSWTEARGRVEGEMARKKEAFKKGTSFD